MTTAISPDDYCKNPQDYKNSPVLTPTTRLYWDQYCQIRKEIENQKMPSTDSVGKRIEDILPNFLLSLMSPQSLAMIGAFMGSTIVYKSLKDNVINAFKNGVSPEAIENAESFIAKGGDPASANLSLVSDTAIKEMAGIDIKVAEEAGYSAGRMSVESLFEYIDLLGGALSYIMLAQLVLQIVGMIFDSWDPCHLNDRLSATTINQFNASFNTIFREQVLIGLNSVIDSYGRMTLNGVYPLPYYAERTALIPFKNKKYDLIRQTLMMKYLSSLRVNSQGDPIYHPKGGVLITNNQIKGFGLTLDRLLGSGNTVVENFLAKWWPIFVGIVVILTFLLFIIKKKRNV